jgi:chromate transport protein ChrA
MERRFWYAMASYAVLGVVGCFLLTGKFRIALLILLAGFAVRTVIARFANRDPL